MKEANYQDDLFTLIKSLNKNEKGYFKKLFSAYKSDNKHIVLFDAIDSQEEYDEIKIAKKLNIYSPSYKVGSSSTVNTAKSYLKKQILKALRIFYDDLNHSSLIEEKLKEILILRSKKLTKLATKEISALKDFADSNECYLESLKINLLFAELGREQKDKENDHDQEELHAQNMYNLERVKNKHKIKHIEHKLSRINKEYFIKPLDKIALKDINNYEEILLGLEFNIDKNSFTETATYYYALGLLYKIKGDEIKSCYFRKIATDEYKKFLVKIKFKGVSTSYIDLLNYLIPTQIYLLQLSEAEKYLKEYIYLHDLKDASERIKINSYSSYLQNKTLLKSISGNVRESEIDSIEKEFLNIDQTKITYYRKCEMSYYLSSAYYLAENYKKALLCVNTIFEHKDDLMMLNTISAAQIIRLFIVIELKNESLFESSYRATTHFLTSRERMGRYEKTLTSFLKRYNDAILKEKSTAELLSEFKSTMQKTHFERHEKNFKKLFNIEAWIEHKIKGTKMVDEIKKIVGT